MDINEARKLLDGMVEDLLNGEFHTPDHSRPTDDEIEALAMIQEEEKKRLVVA